MTNLDDFYMGLGSRVRQWRLRGGLTQEQLADALSLNRTSVTNIEKGKQKILLHTLVQIAEVLEINTEDLIPPPPAVNRSPSVTGMLPKGATDKQRQFLKSIIGHTEGAPKSNEGSSKIHRKTS